MALLRRQSIDYQYFDDQDPFIWGDFAGQWIRYTAEGFYNNTLTSTSTPGASISFTFSGSQAWFYGGLLNTTIVDGQLIYYPIADYEIDGSPVDFQRPSVDSGRVLYFETPSMAEGTHKINIVVASANATVQYIIDYVATIPILDGSNSSTTVITLSSSVTHTSLAAPPSTATLSSAPSATVTRYITRPTPVGGIVGGVVGGVAGIVILVTALWYFLNRRSRGGQAYYFKKSIPDDILAGEAFMCHVEPFNSPSATSALLSTGSNEPDPQSTYPTQSVTSSLVSQSRTGKTPLIPQRYQDTQEPVQEEDAGIRFNENGERQSGPSQAANRIPPAYTPN